MSPSMAVLGPSSRPGFRSWQSPVWLPWVTAPLFFLLPIGGCGIAATRRPPLDVASAPEPVLPGPVEPVATMVTAMTSPR